MHHVLLLLALLSLLAVTPAIADSHDPTLVHARENTSTYAVSGSLTDGEYVVWQGMSTSVHSHCAAINAARLDDRENFSVIRIRDNGAFALGDGYVVAGSVGGHCEDGQIDNSVEGGIYLVDLATLEQTLLHADGDGVRRMAIDYPYVAWATLEFVPSGVGEGQLAIWAVDATSGEPPVQITSEEFSAGLNLSLFVEGEDIIWVTSFGSNAVGNAGRASIGDDPTYFMSMHDTTEVALAGDTMVTLTHGRPLYHNLSDGGTRWLGDEGASEIATDGRFVFWTTDEGKPAITGYDLLTDARFRAWDVPTDEPSTFERIIDIRASGGALAWTRYAYNDYMTAIHGSPVAERLPSAFQSDPGMTSPDWDYHPESGHYLANDFRDFWNANGGLPVFGYPLTEEFDYVNHGEDAAYAAQMTERQRFEWHPENIGTPYAILLGRLGETILAQQGRDWTAFEKADPGADHYFAETGHAIAPEFWDYWSSHGLDMGDPGVSYAESLALFGFPLSEPMLETNPDGDTVLTQYFERAVFEHHPDNPVEHQVLLRRLGAELLTAWDW